MKIKIHGAGSIGNHLANAARTLGWEVAVCDLNRAALDRMKNEIYPSRYGKWDDAIKLYQSTEAPTGGFDVVHIGTPPEAHIALALSALKESPRAILIEKPLCPPSLESAQELYSKAAASKTKVFVGYDHVIGKALKKTEEILKSGVIGDVVTFDVEFREHWEGIFKAHPWLKGPEDTYLGYWEKGGGASGEHSHALNLWQHFAHTLGAGRVASVSAAIEYKQDGKAVYDSIFLLNLKTEKGKMGRVVQDVVTKPSRKRAVLQGTKGSIEWIANHSPDGDAVFVLKSGEATQTHPVPKKRPDDFIEELKHIEQHVNNNTPSPISLERGLDTMRVLVAAHQSAREERTIPINYDSLVESVK